MIMGWTTDQWIEFACFTAAGLAGLGLIALWIRDRQRTAEPVTMRQGPVAEHLAAGPGSLTTLRAQEERDTLIRITHADLIDPAVERAFAVVFDRRARALTLGEHGPAEEQDGVMTRFEAAMEPAMRTARLWLLQGQSEHRGGASARAELDRWRINTPTGEYAMVEV